MDAELDSTQTEFQALDDKMARVSQVATRIGDRLQVRSRSAASFQAMGVPGTGTCSSVCNLQTLHRSTAA